MKEDNGFGGMKWECLAVTLDEFTAFIASIEKSRDPNEKILRKRIVDGVLPLLEQQEEARKRKQAQKERELLNLEKLAHAKRSSRIAGKMEQQKHEEEAREAERKKQAELTMARKEQEKWQKLEKERESRMMTREQRLKEREARRILHEEELANLSEDSKKIGSGEGRLSERHLKAEIERKKQALEELAEEEDWIFDCICGAYGQIDDGTHSIACDKCNIWQHSKCVGVSETDADSEDFSFVCKTCEKRAKDEERAKTHPPIKIRLNRPGSSSSSLPPQQTASQSVVHKLSANNGSTPTWSSPQKQAQNSNGPVAGSIPPLQFSKQNGHHVTSAPYGQPYTKANSLQGRPSPFILPPQSYETHSSPQRCEQRSFATAVSAPGAEYAGPHGSHQTNGSHTVSPYGAPRPSSSHAFSSPHPYSPTSLPPPGQPQLHTFMNGNYGNHTATNVPTSAQSSSQSPQVQGSPSLSVNRGLPQTLNGSRPGSSDSDQRRGSVNLQSPLSNAPVLTPSHKVNSTTNLPALSSPAFYPTPNMVPKSSPPQAYATAISQSQEDVAHASALPSALTGLSPTKHSPPRPSSNGSFSAGTPSMLPPVLSLSPSPQHQNLTPPVKPSEPNRLHSQTISHELTNCN
jgi:hypothetical protein